jgi:hypothetical protein
MHDPAMRRALSLLLPIAVASAVSSFSTDALAGQATLANPPPDLRPGPTKTVHEIGFSTNGSFGPDAFIPAFNWRFHFPSTGRIGQLSGLFMGLDIGPSVNFHGRGWDRGAWNYGYHGQVWGHGGYEIGYEIDPWSNLALTFSPVIHNDFHFSPYFFQFAQTFGPAVRLYIKQHWIFYFEPGFFGWSFYTDGDVAGASLSVRGGVGFAYKF